MYNQPFKFICSDAELAALCVEIAGVPAIALDTEFVREDTYYPKPALLQLHHGAQVSLIDPLAITDFSPLVAVLRDPAVVKVMHSCSEDMEVFSTLLQALPVNIFDTQVAAALCGLGFSLGYQKMVEVLLGHELTKTETRSKWLQRPLSDEQCQYALHDVLWLLDIYQQLQERLAALGRQHWCADDCARICANAERATPDDTLYLRVKAAWRLPPPGLAVLRGLCAWRERMAREQNVPKGRILIDATLMDIAARAPGNRQALAACAQIRQATVRRWGDEIIDCVQSALRDQGDVQHGSIGLLPAKGDRSHRELLKRLQSVTREVAEQLDLPVEALAKKRDLEEYIEVGAASLIGQGWRAPLLAAKLDAELAVQAPAQNE